MKHRSCQPALRPNPPSSSISCATHLGPNHPPTATPGVGDLGASSAA